MRLGCVPVKVSVVISTADNASKNMVRTKTGEPGGKQEKVQMGQLERALDVVHALNNSLQPLKLTALAEITRLDPSGTLRLLKSLVDLGYVTRDDQSKSYLPSPKSLFPLSLFHPFQELRRDAADLLYEIQRDTTATSALQLFLGGQRVVIEQRAGANRLTPYVEPIVRSELHASASGKALLSTLSPDQRQRLLGPESYARFTPQTMTTLQELEQDLEISRERGYFAVNEEAMQGMSAITAPVFLNNGCVVGCMVAFGTSQQLPRDAMRERGQVVKRGADILSTMSPALRALEPLLSLSSNQSKSTQAIKSLDDGPPLQPKERSKNVSSVQVNSRSSRRKP